MVMREEWDPDAEGFDEIDDEAAGEEPEGESNSSEEPYSSEALKPRVRVGPGEDARLRELSARWKMGECSAHEEHEYFDLMGRILRRYSLRGLLRHPVAARRLERDREDIIQEFILTKFLQLNSEGQLKAPCFDHAGGLRHYFRNFLVDWLRRASVKHYQAQADITEDEGRDGEYKTTGDNGLREKRISRNDSASDELRAMLEPAPGYGLRFRQLMADYMLSYDKVFASACDMLASWPGWAQAYLEHNHFARGEPEPLSVLVERFDIKSFSYKLGRLGLKPNGSMKDFEGTLFGRWVREVIGAPITSEDEELIYMLTDILGEAVRARAEALSSPGGM